MTKTNKPTKTVSGIRTVGLRGKIDVSALLQQGVMPNLEIGRWRAENRLTLTDLCMDGIKSDLISEYMKLGRKSLIDPKIQRSLNTIESAARYAVKRFSLMTPLGLFVPAAAYPMLDAEMDKFEKQWFEGRDKLTKHIQSHERDITKTYKKLALSIFNLMKHSRIEAKEKSNFASQYARRILAAMPTANEVYNSFHFSFQTSDIPNPTVLDEKVKASLLNDEKVKAKLTTINKREAQVREMNERRLRRIEKNKNELDDRFLNAVNQQIRGKVLNAVTTALYTIDKHKFDKDKLPGRTVSQLNNMIKSFHMLNILNDVEVEREINKLEKELQAASKDRNPGTIAEMLMEIKDITSDQLLDMGYIGRTPRGNIIADHHAPEGLDLPTSRRLADVEVADEIEVEAI